MTHNQVAYLTGMEEVKVRHEQNRISRDQLELDKRKFKLQERETEYNIEQNAIERGASVVSGILTIGAMIMMCL